MEITISATVNYPEVEKQMEKKMEGEMESGIYLDYMGD